MKLLYSAPCLLLVWSISYFAPAKSYGSVKPEDQKTRPMFEGGKTQFTKVVGGTEQMPPETIFYAHGDVPYSQRQAKKLEKQMLEVPDDAEFVIHVGDLRRAGPSFKCVRSEYENAAALFRLSHAPVFVLLGDNDWTDCPNREEGLRLWQDEFVGFESKYWDHTFDIQRHEGYPYNFAFTHKETLFIGLNIVGGNVHDAEEWTKRLTDQGEWTIELIRSYQQSSPNVGRVVIFGHANPNLRHRSFFEPLTAFIKNELKSSIPLLYVNGDKHKWMYQPNFYNEPSLLRMTVTGLAVDPLVKVTIAADGLFRMPEEAFVIDRRLSSLSQTSRTRQR